MSLFVFFSIFFNSLDFTALQSALTLIFAIEEINNSSSLLPGITLGYRVYDTCSSASMGVKMAMALVKGYEISNQSEPCTKPAQVQAVIGEAYSSVSVAVAKTIGPFSIPQVSICLLAANVILRTTKCIVCTFKFSVPF